MGVELPRELVETTLLTGRVIGAEPVSLFFIAGPESGKTSIVLERESSCAFPLTDVTGRGLQQLCQSRPEITHFIINDLVAVMAHRASVNRYTLAMLIAMTEEGIKAVAYPGSLEVFKHGRRGVIACLTLELAKDGRMWWNKTGFSSRMLPFCYKYSKNLTIRIVTSIAEGSTSKEKPGTLKIPSEPVAVELDKRLARSRLIPLIDRIAERFGEKGIRRAYQLRALVQAHALRRSWKKPRVMEEDIQFLEKIERFLSYRNAETL